MKKDWHIIIFEEDKDEDKYVFFEREIWSENITSLVKDIQFKIIVNFSNKVLSYSFKYFV